MSMQQLAAVLQASHGSISMATQMLTRLGMVEKVSVPGERKHFYRIGHNAWSESFVSKLNFLDQMLELANRGLKLLEDAPNETRKSLESMRSFFAFFRGELADIDERWKRSQRE